jgi:hypothetical protein
MQRSNTRSISIDAPPDVVLGLVSDATLLPRWAPAFARAVRPAEGDRWLIDTGEGEVPIRVRVSREHGTVDFLLAGVPPGLEIGAFSRVVPNGQGSEYIFTRFFADAMPDIELAEQTAVVAVELQTVRALCEAAAEPRAAAA